MPNPRLVENYRPGIDDDPSSYNDGAFPTTPASDTSGAFPTTTNTTISPLNEVRQQQQELVHRSLGKNSNTNNNLVSTQQQQQQSPHVDKKRTVTNVEAQHDDERGQEEDEEEDSSNLVIATLVVVLITIIVIVVAIVLLRDDDDNNNADEPIDPPSTIPVPNQIELRRAVDALLTDDGFGAFETMYGEIKDWDVSRIFDFSQLFAVQRIGAVASTFTADLSAWNCSQGTNFFGMFQGAASFNVDVSTWDVSKGTNFAFMFAETTSFNQNVSGWNMQSATTIESMFEGASNFQQNLCPWTETLDINVTTTDAFAGTSCPSADDVTSLSGIPPGPMCFDCPLEGTSFPTNAPTASPTLAPKSCFESGLVLTLAVDDYLTDPTGGLTEEKYGHPIGTWCVGNVEDFSRIFSAARNPSAEFFNEDISQWDTSSASNMVAMFYGAKRFNQNITGWDVRNVVDFSIAFGNCTLFNQDLSLWRPESALFFSFMFSRALSFDADLSTWADMTSGVNVLGMFEYAASFTGKGLDNWDMSETETLEQMFNRADVFNADLSQWNVSRVENLALIFNGATSFTSDLSAWDVSNVQIFAVAFAFTEAFNSDLSTWDVSSATDMYAMFAFAEAFNSDVSAWQVQDVTTMELMFYEATEFRQDLCSWGTRLVPSTLTDDAFLGTNCPRTETPSWDATPPGPFCFVCELTDSTPLPDSTPVPAPTSLPTPALTSAPTNEMVGTNSPTASPTFQFPRCFSNTTELITAVDNFFIDPLSEELSQYGPINAWCVSKISVFDQVNINLCFVKRELYVCASYPVQLFCNTICSAL